MAETGTINRSDREFDVIVYGATGFTGRLVAEHLLKTYGVGGNVSWAMAGRDADKLSAVASEIGASEAPAIIANASDPSSLIEMASRASAIVTTVGPYTAYGAPLVQACVEAGTDYADLCGEPPFMRQMIDTYHEQAKEKNVRIVHSCGFDSIPFDLGVYFVQSLHKEAYGRPASRVDGIVVSARGGISGGTIASGLMTRELVAKDRSARKVMNDIYALAPDGTADRPRQPDPVSPRFSRTAKRWVAPFIMAEINMRNVHRSNLLMDYAYGQDFKYCEMMAAPNAPAAYSIAAGSGAATALLGFGPARSFLKNTVLPKPGEGPSAQDRERGSYKIEFTATGEGGETSKAIVTGDRDPGYGSTSKMLAESGLCLASEGADGEKSGGVMTAAAALGGALIDRLQQNAGLEFTTSQ
ncbi:MAG: saccharopine dehydrogenase NADP-binding domain-containing protein [Pseudomonadota bacterium]